MPDFVTSYNESLINTIYFMTPAEELETLKDTIAEWQSIAADKDAEIAALRALLGQGQ